MKAVNYACQYGNIAGLCWGYGNKHKILALHGWLDNAASFCQLAPLLAQSDYEVVAIDFAGHGLSDHRAVGHHYHISDYVFDVQQVLALLNWHKPILLGHSMGAAIAHMYGVSFAENIEKLIMLENLGPVPAEEKATAATQLKQALSQWQNHSNQHNHYYANTQLALEARLRVTPMQAENLQPMVTRGLKKTAKGYHWRTDKRLRLRSPFRFAEPIVQDMLAATKPTTQLILAKPYSYALNFKNRAQRIKKLNPHTLTQIAGHHHLHMDKAQEVCVAIEDFLNL